MDQLPLPMNIPYMYLYKGCAWVERRRFFYTYDASQTRQNANVNKREFNISYQRLCMLKFPMAFVHFPLDTVDVNMIGYANATHAGRARTIGKLGHLGRTVWNRVGAMALTTATTLTLTAHMRRTTDQKNQVLQQTWCTLWSLCNLHCLVGNFVLDFGKQQK